ncbi:PadR family transcriptional regulator [Nesterenkonia halotolerans]|uniref:PadR family transcriptional regulator n=1 Tax=Nesterenkonia halotolerans TaxID=225325 RepID=UPI003EE63E44
MAKNPRLPLTETVYYILLALHQPGHGYLIMSRVEEMSGGTVRLAPGTLYGALENLMRQGLIARIPSDEPRRKVYQITVAGEQTAVEDTHRMRHMIAVYRQTREGSSHDR